MNDAEQRALLALAESDTLERRRESLVTFIRGRGVRLADETRETLRRLLDDENEASRLRPMPDATLHASELVRVEPGPDPILPPRAARLLEEWIGHWLAEERLRGAGCATPGPLLLHGPPGTGKTTATRAIARVLAKQRHTYSLDAHAWVSSHLGESGAKLAKIIGTVERLRHALVLEELDAVAMTRSSDGGAAAAEQTRITTALMRLIETSTIPLVATTNRLDAIDPAIRRRCEYVIELPEPTLEQKRRIVGEILGAEPDDVEGSLVELVPLARRARRWSVIAGVAPAEAWGRVRSEEEESDG